MDLIGLLPKSVHGHECISGDCSYTIHYPEAIPLCKATSRNRELMLLFSQLGIPTDLLTEQGTPFISKLMVDIC